MVLQQGDETNVTRPQHSSLVQIKVALALSAAAFLTHCLAADSPSLRLKKPRPVRDQLFPAVESRLTYRQQGEHARALILA